MYEQHSPAPVVHYYAVLRIISANFLDMTVVPTAYIPCTLAHPTPGAAPTLHGRRQALAQGLRQLRGLTPTAGAHRCPSSRQSRQPPCRARQRRRLDVDTVVATSHKSNLTGLTIDTDASELFGGDVKCILEPEVTQGPYYVNGELVRSDIREEEEGVDLYAEIQIIDVNTCEPVEGLYLDFWHCNATGVYSGIVASGNGDSSDTTNIDKTFLRGLTPTDEDGVASYTSSSRATTRPAQRTSTSSARTTARCSRTTRTRVDMRRTWGNSSSTRTYQRGGAHGTLQHQHAGGHDQRRRQDPVRGGSRGLRPLLRVRSAGRLGVGRRVAWISVGVDMTRAQTITAAGTLTSDGGVMAESTSTMGGGGGMGPGSGMGGFGGGSGMGGFGGSVGGPEGSFDAASSEAGVTQNTGTGAEQSTTSGSVEAAASDVSCNVRRHR
ncbi:Intradiol ring-cleavage dioxygenase, core [Phytophthora cactorum]|nr:Intradiol ring-cleavage dioxygenase, core [Phytophthora cactorum]